MKITRRMMIVTASLAIGTAGCTSEPGADQAAPMANPALGIAGFELRETVTQTSVIGVDAAGWEVARLDLIHGRFALTDRFRADYATPEVVGRKLDVSIRGQKQLVWETAGYAPTLHLPAHPAGLPMLAAFLDDPHVTAVLDRWQIGFERRPTAGADASGFHVGTTRGTDPYDCLGNVPNTACGIARTSTINTCGGGNVPYQATRLTHSTPADSFDEYVVTQCCPPIATIPSDWFAVKACPTVGVSGPQSSSCGETGGSAACKSCPGYPTAQLQFCSMAWSGTELDWCHDATAGQTLTVRVVPEETVGTVQVDSPYGFPAGTLPGGTNVQQRCSGGLVSLTAIVPELAGWTFTGWSGACAGTASTCTLTMDGAKSVVARFRPSGE